MKKVLFSFLISFIFLSLASPVLGIQTTPSAILNQPKNLREEATQGATSGKGLTIREEAREKNQERIATFQARLSVRKKEIIRNHFARVTRRLEAVINRFNRLIERIESRISKIEANDPNIDTSLMKKQIEQAKEKLNSTKNQLDEAKTQMEVIIESNTPHEGFLQVKDIITEIRKNLIEIHQILVKVIGDIKGLRVGNTSTPSVQTD